MGRGGGQHDTGGAHETGKTNCEAQHTILGHNLSFCSGMITP